MATRAKVRRTLIMCCLCAPTRWLELSKLFWPPRGPGSAHKHHCLLVCWPSARRISGLWDPLMLLLPRRPIHPPAGKYSHPLSSSKAPSVNSKGGSAFSNKLDHIPTRLLSARYAVIQNYLCFVDDRLTRVYIIHFKSPTWELYFLKDFTKPAICTVPYSKQTQLPNKLASQWIMIHSLTSLKKNQKQTTASGTFRCVLLSGQQLHGRNEESSDKYRTYGFSIFLFVFSQLVWGQADDRVSPGLIVITEHVQTHQRMH